VRSKSKVCANVFCGAGRECAVTEKGEPTCLCVEVSQTYSISDTHCAFLNTHICGLGLMACALDRKKVCKTVPCLKNAKV